MTDQFLPYTYHSIDESDITAVTDVMRNGMLTGGPLVQRLEECFTAETGASHAVACANGTAALHLAAMALGWKTGDRVIVPSVTFLASANAARFVGADVVFADVDPDTGLMTVDTLNEAIVRGGAAVKGMIPVHLAGQCVEMPAVGEVARRHGLSILEDACHALGTETENGPVGNCRDSDAAMFSLHPAKTVAMGEGGVVLTNDGTLASAMRRFRSHGMVYGDFTYADQAIAADGQANPWYYEMPEIGYNYRVPDILCAMGASQMARLAAIVARRRALAARYDTLLEPLAPILKPLARVDYCRPAWHLYVVLIDFDALGLDRAATMRRLKSVGIGTQVHYLPVHRQPYYRRRYGDISLPGADEYYRRALSLPLFPAMADGDVERVVAALSNIVGKG